MCAIRMRKEKFRESECLKKVVLLLSVFGRRGCSVEHGPIAVHTAAAAAATLLMLQCENAAVENTTFFTTHNIYMNQGLMENILFH